MDLKKKIKDHLSLTRKANDGFTLVELIVVIAILGILAGVGTVGYSGYITKANQAADEQLLSSLNTAFAAACMANGEDNYGRTDRPAIAIGTDGAVATDALTTGSENVNESFADFYEGGAFKGFRKLFYDKTVGGFVNAADNMFYQIFSSLGLDDYVNTVNESTFGKKIGAEGLMTRVDHVTTLAEALLGTNAGTNLKNALSADYATIAASMGMSESELQALVNSQDDKDAYWNNLLSNYAVLQVANTTASKDTAALLADLRTGMTTSDISNMIASNDTTSSKEGVAKAAMMYAMYTAYANQLEDDDTKTAALANLKDMDTFVNAIGTETQSGTGFMTYLSDAQATKDMDGFLASMNIITESTEDNPEATRDLMENGYNNSTLISALQGLLGS